jgi:quinol-cytochrome oxidoreductase complex cytochrome b subunit
MKANSTKFSSQTRMINTQRIEYERKCNNNFEGPSLDKKKRDKLTIFPLFSTNQLLFMFGFFFLFSLSLSSNYSFHFSSGHG